MVNFIKNRYSYILYTGLLLLMFVPLTLFAAVSADDNNLQGKTGFLPELENFKVDIEKEKKNITNALSKTKPLTEEFKSAAGELKQALTSAKQDLNPKTISELEHTFAERLNKISSKMAAVLGERPRLQDAFQEIDREFGDSVEWIDQQVNKRTDELQITAEKLKKLKKEAAKIAREYKSVENPSNELRNKLLAFKDEIALLEYNLRSSTNEQGSLKNAGDQLKKAKEGYRNLGKHVDLLVAKLGIERSKYDRITEMRIRISSIKKGLYGLSSETDGAIAWATQIQDLWSIVDNFSTLEVEVGNVLNTMIEIPSDMFDYQQFAFGYDNDLDDWIDSLANLY